MKPLVNYCAAGVLGAALLLAGGCAAPMGARLSTPQAAYAQLHASALATGEPSPNTRNILRRYDQELAFEESPDAVLKLIYSKAVASGDRNELFALAELNFLVAEQVRHSAKPWEPRDARDYYLASAVYSYLFLFGEAEQARPSSFDPRFRIACDLYGTALGLSLTERRSKNAVAILEGGTRALPTGKLPVTLVTDSLPWQISEFQETLLADPFEIYGITVRNRRPGIGVPLMGVTKLTRDSKLSTAAPMTAFLRVEGGLKELDAGQCRASLELYSGHSATTVNIAGQSVPLAADLTAPMAYSMNQDLIWALGRVQFLSGNETVPTGVYELQPYEPGKIPVVFVHGTFSSPVYWAEMINTLRADDLLTRRYQFWYFIYNSGNPIAYSAGRLRQALEKKLKDIDPDGKDAALQQMVVIGHSQGGLLTKLTATDTGDTFLRIAVSNRVETLTAEDHAIIDPWLVYKPLPFVKRVVFVCTPHRGSYQIGGFLLGLAQRLVSIPGKLNDAAKDAMERVGRAKGEKTDEQKALAMMPNSIYGMSSKNPFLLPLANLHVAPGIAAHSIIAVKGEDDFRIGNDGVVAYTSAHVDYVESEFIVRSGHSCQSLPPTIEEVRRILYEHIAHLTPGAVTPPVAAPK